MTDQDRESYDPAQVLGGLNPELARLRAQADLSWSEEARLLTQAGLVDGMSILEIGCGPGYITQRLLEMLPRSFVTAVDIDAMLLDIAQRNLAPWRERHRLVMSSIYSLGLPDTNYDFVLVRYVLQHLSNPQSALAEIMRVLKPGGTLAVIEVDANLWGISEPHIDQLERIYAQLDFVQAEQGGNRRIGRELWRLLRNAGYDAPHLDVYAYHSDELGIEPFLPQLDPKRLLPAVNAGQVSFLEYATIQLALQEFTNHQEAYILMLGFCAHARKPLGSVTNTQTG